MKIELAVVIALIFIASLLVSGCTTSTNTPTSTPLPSTDAAAAAITDELLQRGFVIITPFVKSTNAAGIVTYTGVVQDGENSLTPFVHNLTLEVTKNRNDTATRVDAWVRNATERGYTGIGVQDVGVARYWESGMGVVANTTHGVWIVGQQPNAFVTVLYATQPAMSVSTLSDGYFVAADFATKA